MLASTPGVFLLEVIPPWQGECVGRRVVADASPPSLTRAVVLWSSGALGVTLPSVDNVDKWAVPAVPAAHKEFPSPGAPLPGAPLPGGVWLGDTLLELWVPMPEFYTDVGPSSHWA